MGKILLDNFIQTRRISLKLVLWTLLFSTIITFIITTIQLFMDFNNGVKSIQTQFTLIEKSYAPLLEQSIWVYDTKQIQLQLQAISHLPDIEYIELTLKDNTVYRHGSSKVVDKSIRTIPLSYIFNDSTSALGSLQVVANMGNIYDFLTKKAIIILFSQGIKTFIISFFTLFLFQRFVTRHLEVIAKFLLTINPKDMTHPLNLSKKVSTPPDELDQVSSAINNMQHILQQSYLSLNDELVKNKNIQKHLEKNQNTLLQAQEIAKLGNWEWNVHTKELTGSVEFFNILGLDMPTNKTISRDVLLEHLNSDVQCELLYILAHEEYNRLENHKVQELFILGKNTQYIRTIFAPFENKGYVGVIQNITSEYLVTLQNSQLLFTMQQSPICIIITNNLGIIEYINAQTLKSYKMDKESLISHNISKLERTANTYEDAFITASTMNIWKGDILEYDNEGHPLTMKTIITPIKDKNNIITQFSIWKEDISEKIDLDRRLLLQSKHAQMGEMISMIAHQWRQPLANISTFSSHLQFKLELDKLTNDDVKKANIAIDEQIKHLSQTLDDFRNFFKPEKNIEIIEFNDIIKSIQGILGSLIKQNSITINLNTPKGLHIQTFKSELVQVLLNLIKNSIDAFKENNIQDAHIDINYEYINERAILTLIDNAGGISAETIDNIFTPYFSTKDDKNGTGLGLYMSKIIIEDHMDGRIEASSKDTNTKFVLSFPSSFIAEV